LGERTGTRRAGKSDTAFRTIGEVAEDLDVPAHVLRFWESKFSQLKPLKRGGGRRYYRPEDVLLLRRIRQCLYQDGYTIKGVQRLLREGALKNMPVAEAAAEPPARPEAGAVKAPPAKADPNLPPLLAAIETAAAETIGELQNVVAEVVQELGDLRDLLRRSRR
jgi:DNA-binding transcriptional MerR regulator